MNDNWYGTLTDDHKCMAQSHKGDREKIIE